jgi:hypothetical protein
MYFIGILDYWFDVNGNAVVAVAYENKISHRWRGRAWFALDVFS